MAHIGSLQAAADFTRRVSDQIKGVQGTATETEQAADGSCILRDLPSKRIS